ncbi:MAG: YcaO-like family protein, partial [Methanomicrobium sp.]|nr:YcaO-like family protein [Methanomicrobium sp.]
CDDYTTRDPAMLVTGSAYDLSPVSAAVQALIEVAQRRASRLNGEYAEKNADQKSLLERAGYDRLKRINSIWFGSANAEADTCRISDMPDLGTDYVNRDIGIILSSIRDSAEYVFAADITKVMPAVRVVIPGFEISCVDPSRIKKTNQ